MLPFDTVEDPIFQWSYNCQVKSRRRIFDRVSELAKDWRTKINDGLNGKFVTVLLDAWTNPINKQSHLRYIASIREQLFYLKSIVVKGKRANDLLQILRGCPRT